MKGRSIGFSAWVVGAVLLAAGGALGAECGGSVPCGCGDRVVRNHVLTSDLGPCPGHGLVIASGVTLDGAGHTIVGSGAKDSYGVYVREAQGAVVVDVAATGFYHGLRLRDSHGCSVVDSEFFANGNFAARAGYGVDVAVGSSGNLFVRNAIYGNADEGIHLGSESGGNELRDNEIYANERENVYLLRSDANLIVGNRVWGGRNSLFVKDSSGNRIEANDLADATFVVRADSHDNEISDNHLTRAGVHFQLYTDEKPYRFPRDNVFRGGSIRDASTCIRFSSAMRNTVVDTVLAGCSTQVRSESKHGPSENSVVGIALDAKRVDLDAGSTLHVLADEGDGGDTVGNDPPGGGGPSDAPAHRDLSVERITAPRLVRLTHARPIRTKRVGVVVRNRGDAAEVIPDAAALAALVALDVESSGACPAPSVEPAGSPARFPIRVEPGGSFRALFEVALGCANDERRKAPAGGDYRWHATVDTGALGGAPDEDASNDACPRAGGRSGCRTGAGKTGGPGVATDVVR